MTACIDMPLHICGELWSSSILVAKGHIKAYLLPRGPVKQEDTKPLTAPRLPIGSSSCCRQVLQKICVFGTLPLSCVICHLIIVLLTI